MTDKEKLLEFLENERQHYIKLRDFMMQEINGDKYAHEHNGRIKFCHYLYFLIERGDFGD